MREPPPDHSGGGSRRSRACSGVPAGSGRPLHRRHTADGTPGDGRLRWTPCRCDRLAQQRSKSDPNRSPGGTRLPALPSCGTARTHRCRSRRADALLSPTPPMSPCSEPVASILWVTACGRHRDVARKYYGIRRSGAVTHTHWSSTSDMALPQLLDAEGPPEVPERNHRRCGPSSAVPRVHCEPQSRRVAGTTHRRLILRRAGVSRA